MTTWELLLIAVGLSMDAFAVAVCKGLAVRRAGYGQALKTGLFFGGFQAIMPLLGFLLGMRFEQYITPIDHWIAFALLGFIGGKMFLDGKKGGDEENCAPGPNPFATKDMLLLSLATSVDALAVGISFAFLRIQIVPAVSLIGLVTLTLSFVGVKLGAVLGSKFQSRAQLAGGAVLVLMGTKILLEHLGLLPF